METPIILSTENYDLFKKVTGNRKVRAAHVKKLKESIDKNPETVKYSPILVNENFEVIDGQHRLAALSELNLPVYYVQKSGLTLDTVRALNSSAKQWQPIDYASAFAELGNPNYQMYLTAKDSVYKVNHDCLIKYLSLENPITSESFKIGKLEVNNFERSMELLKRLHDLSDYKRYNTRNFALAFLRLTQEQNYDHERMVKQFKSNLHRFEDKASEVDFFKELNRIYNFGLSKDRHQFFGTAEYLNRSSK